MKRYFAWVFFVLGSVNIIGAGIRVAEGKMPTIFDGLANASLVVSFVSLTSLFLFLWWKWK